MKAIELLLKENTERMIYVNYLKQILQVKRNNLFDSMIKFNTEYNEWRDEDNKSISHVKHLASNILWEMGEIEKVEEEINKYVHDEDEFI